MRRPRGQLLFTYYVLAEKADERAVYTWAEDEPKRPYPWTTRDYEDMLTDARLDIRIKEDIRSEEHTSELQSIMSISYAVFCLTKKKPAPDETAPTHTLTST